MMLNDPLKIATPRTVISRGISYAVSWAADLIPPIKVYLLLDDQPAKKTPSGAIPKIAIMKSRDSSGFAAQICGPNGINAKTIIVVARMITGAISKTNLSAFSGTMCSFETNLTKSATF